MDKNHTCSSLLTKYKQINMTSIPFYEMTKYKENMIVSNIYYQSIDIFIEILIIAIHIFHPCTEKTIIRVLIDNT